MKILSIIVPCYNSQDYMRYCVESLLAGGSDVEIIIVNDGSTDNTAEIAEEYKNSFPHIVRVIHQQNKGHGGAINTGISAASGMYLKVVDSDDWVDSYAYAEVVKTLRAFAPEECPDLVISNYVYEKAGKRNKWAARFVGMLPENRVFTWDDVKRFKLGHYMLMHSLVYRLELLKDCGLRLPEHTFYVDNLFAFIPMMHVETMYYLNTDFYRYYIGRAGQSVHEKIMIKRVDQQLAVNYAMIDYFCLKHTENVKKRAYLAHYLEIVTTVSTIFLILDGTEHSMAKKRLLWNYISMKDARLYDMLRSGFLGKALHFPIRWIVIMGYKLIRLVVGFS